MEMEKGRIVLLGLGPGDASLITRSAWQVLLETGEVYLRTRHHPAVAGLPEHLEIHSFDHYYESEADFHQVYDRITEEILRLATRPQGVVYAVPGSPFIAEATSTQIVQRAMEAGIHVRVVEGASFIESTLTALRLDAFPQLSVVDALELATQHVPAFPPDRPALIGQIYSKQVASDVKLTLMEIYPEKHPVRLIHHAGTDRVSVEEVPLHQIDHGSQLGMLTSIYIPPLEPGTSFESFQEVIAHLRAPDGCPWDREQTHLSLRTNLLEETYETLSAIDKEDPRAMQEEFGDLLLQIVLHAQIASEFGDFTMAAMIKGIYEKIIRRHPHVFGDVEVESVEQVLKNWEMLKSEERKHSDVAASSLLDGVPQNLPALAQADQYQSRASRTGFEWSDPLSLINKLFLELGNIRTTQNAKDQDRFIGELLFTVTSLARHYGVDPESALRTVNERFRTRFRYMEDLLREAGKQLQDLTQEEYRSIWEQVTSEYP